MTSFLFGSRLVLLQNQNVYFSQLEPSEIWSVLPLLALSWVQVPTHFHPCSNIYPAVLPGIRSFPTAWWNIFSALVLMPNEIVRARKCFDSKLEYGFVKSQQSRAVSKCCVCCGYGKQIPMLLQSSFLASLVSSTILPSNRSLASLPLWRFPKAKTILCQFHSSVDAGGFDFSTWYKTVLFKGLLAPCLELCWSARNGLSIVSHSWSGHWRRMELVISRTRTYLLK